MQAKIARSFWIEAPGRSAIREHELPALAPGEVQVRTLYSGVSRGSELLVFRGRVPTSEYTRMRAPHQQGDFPGPVKYGYCSVGVVEAGEPALLGREVFCLFPHQTHYNVSARAVVPLPRSVPVERAVLAANLETALNGLWDAAPRLGDQVSVVGAGTLGCLVAWLAGQIPGCDVELIDTDASKAVVASALSVSFAAPGAARSDNDLVIHASATQAGLSTALGLAAFEASVIELSWFGDGEVCVPLGEAFHAERLTLRSSQVGSVAGSQRARWNSARRMTKVMELLQDPTLDSLISGESPFEALPSVMRALADGPSGTLCHRIKY